MSVATKPSQYVVAAGDTLGAIARRFGYSVDELVVANEIPDPDRIAVGQMLQLPLEEKGELGRAEEGGTQGSLRILFVDKLLRAISGLEFVLESNRGVILEGITNADGLSESVSELRVGEELSLLVKRARGGFKKVISTTFGGGERILTAYSPALLVKSRTEAHEGIPGNDRSAEGHPLIRIDAGEVALDFLDFDSGERIEESDYEVAASLLGCEVAAIKAVAQAETGAMGSFFQLRGWDSVPAILYERHYFHRLTSGAFDASHPDISDRRAGAGGTWSDQYRKLLRAYALSEEAALKSASWTKFQIMGANHVAAGFESVREMVRAASVSEKFHLRMFVSFISSDAVLQRSLVGKDWLAFARRYNGPAQRGYDLRMRENYENFRRNGARND
ncbi:N-acetylmuramidase domain-containing protein [Alkalisalibacterium limincola]|uniref:DUF3380 domain-containing protein n=1 Tax=Alkalisalibacterium limincola TaxID=2699169 RepID=A0A5C8KJQ7_9GAMM|nr:N-acetylmuramidase domain-containing protein [Alkalisalibacterium limincola]TXK60978.1 DUF3380 domain-containing protein [Alkalisalibacterium limincola]